MEEIINKEIAKKLMETEGETRGFNLKHDAEYIRKTKGKEGVKKIEEALAELGYPVEFKKIKHMDFVPAGLKVLTLLVIRKIFGADDEEIKRVCAAQPKSPLIVKLFMRYIYSIPKVMEKAPHMWRTYWSRGNLHFAEYNEKEKYAVVRIENINLHDIFCCCMEGYFIAMGELILGKREITCQETECALKGGKYHEFVIKWK